MAKKTKKASININLSELMSSLRAQFQGLDFRNPSTLPVIPRYALLVVAALVVLALLWYVFLSDLSDQLNTAREQETKLRHDYTDKVQKAASLGLLEKQKKEIELYVDTLEKQLPNKSEMDALLSDINQAGLEHNLQFDLFKPGTLIVKEYYAELPISLKVTGRYRDIGAFAADIAALSRIVTLSNLNLRPADKKHPDQLTLDATARTFRYLNPDEVNAHTQAKGGKK